MADSTNNGYNGYTPKKDKKSLSNGWKLALIALLGVLVISPIDAIPDPIAVAGWADDLAYLVGIIGTITTMVKGKNAMTQQDSYTPPMYNDVESNEKKNG